MLNWHIRAGGLSVALFTTLFLLFVGASRGRSTWPADVHFPRIPDPNAELEPQQGDARLDARLTERPSSYLGPLLVSLSP
jgi:hypothetical protein